MKNKEEVTNTTSSGSDSTSSSPKKTEGSPNITPKKIKNSLSTRSLFSYWQSEIIPGDYDVLLVSLPKISHLQGRYKDIDMIAFCIQAQVLKEHRAIPILIKESGGNLHLYTNKDGSSWKTTAIEKSIFPSEDFPAEWNGSLDKWAFPKEQKMPTFNYKKLMKTEISEEMWSVILKGNHRSPKRDQLVAFLENEKASGIFADSSKELLRLYSDNIESINPSKPLKYQKINEIISALLKTINKLIIENKKFSNLEQLKEFKLKLIEHLDNLIPKNEISYQSEMEEFYIEIDDICAKKEKFLSFMQGGSEEIKNHTSDKLTHETSQDGLSRNSFERAMKKILENPNIESITDILIKGIFNANFTEKEIEKFLIKLKENIEEACKKGIINISADSKIAKPKTLNEILLKINSVEPKKLEKRYEILEKFKAANTLFLDLKEKKSIDINIVKEYLSEESLEKLFPNLELETNKHEIFKDNVGSYLVNTVEQISNIFPLSLPLKEFDEILLLTENLKMCINKIKEQQIKSEKEALEKSEKEKAEREAREKKEKAEKEARDKEEEEKAEREAREKKEKAEKEARDKEEEEKAEGEARDKAKEEFSKTDEGKNMEAIIKALKKIGGNESVKAEKIEESRDNYYLKVSEDSKSTLFNEIYHGLLLINNFTMRNINTFIMELEDKKKNLEGDLLSNEKYPEDAKIIEDCMNSFNEKLKCHGKKTDSFEKNDSCFALLLKEHNNFKEQITNVLKDTGKKIDGAAKAVETKLWWNDFCKKGVAILALAVLSPIPVVNVIAFSASIAIVLKNTFFKSPDVQPKNLKALKEIQNSASSLDNNIEKKTKLVN